VLAGYRDLIAQHQPPIVHIRGHVTCPPGGIGPVTFDRGHYVVVVGVYQPVGGDPLVITLDPAENLDFWIRNWNTETTYCLGTPAQITVGFEDYAREGHGEMVARPMPVTLRLLENTPSAGQFAIEADVQLYPKAAFTGTPGVYGWTLCNLERPLNGCLLETTDHLRSNTYEGAPADGSAWVEPWHPEEVRRVRRGGYHASRAEHIAATVRFWQEEGATSSGFRLCRSVAPQ